MNNSTQLKANILGGMNEYILNMGDEDILDFWWEYGLPNECDEDTLMEIAEDEGLFASISIIFGNILSVEVLGKEN